MIKIHYEIPHKVRNALPRSVRVSTRRYKDKAHKLFKMLLKDPNVKRPIRLEYTDTMTIISN